MRPDAVFWDMDGTLIDSEPLHDAALESVLKSLDIEPPADLHEKILGLSARPVYDMLSARYAITLPFREWIGRKYAFYLHHAPNLKPRPGAVEIFRALQEAGVPQAIVSNSDRLVVDANLRATGLQEAAAISVSRNDVREGKPEPEPFLRAAYLCGVEPSRCAVVEDSRTGAQAGLAAGMTTLFWPQLDLEAPEGALYLSSPEEVRARLLRS
ncbi:MAG: HAD family hydrolase [Mesorhizobium amorphae]|nr:MAG: HAD family hydrolase [Mesorhizobium amorphae]